MLKIPSVIEARFDAALAEKAVPQRLNFHYKKWLRYYLDFCHNYHLDKSAKQSLSDFTKKLREKRQNDQQQKQAAHAISIFYEIGRFKSNKKTSSREKIGVSPTKKEHLKPTGADWKPVYDNLHAEIKLRHYSPKTLRAYRGWIRQFQNFAKSKDPQALSSSDVKDFLTFLAVKRKVSASSQNQAFNEESVDGRIMAGSLNPEGFKYSNTGVDFRDLNFENFNYGIPLISGENLVLIRKIISKTQYNLSFGLHATTHSFFNPINCQW